MDFDGDFPEKEITLNYSVYGSCFIYIYTLGALYDMDGLYWNQMM
jgi:hypothetical protein